MGPKHKKIDMNKGNEVKRQANLIRLKTAELWKAVEQERLERAAELRDEIRLLQSAFISYLANS